MSEECSDYVDNRIKLRDALRRGRINVKITKHALQRLMERRPKPLRKPSRRVLEDIIVHVLRDGEYRVFTDRIFVWTKKYLLVCQFDVYDRLVVKTVLNPKTIKSSLLKIMTRGINVKWHEILVNGETGM